MEDSFYNSSLASASANVTPEFVRINAMALDWQFAAMGLPPVLAPITTTTTVTSKTTMLLPLTTPVAQIIAEESSNVLVIAVSSSVSGLVVVVICTLLYFRHRKNLRATTRDTARKPSKTMTTKFSTRIDVSQRKSLDSMFSAAGADLRKKRNL